MRSKNIFYFTPVLIPYVSRTEIKLYLILITVYLAKLLNQKSQATTKLFLGKLRRPCSVFFRGNLIIITSWLLTFCTRMENAKRSIFCSYSFFNSSNIFQGKIKSLVTVSILKTKMWLSLLKSSCNYLKSVGNRILKLTFFI